MQLLQPISLDPGQQQYAQYVARHETTHALGFSLGSFQRALNPDGSQKVIASLLPVADLDGSTDSVWTVVSTRAVEVGRQYFGCAGLTGVPLMGDNVLGAVSRGSHWETRTMNDGQ